MDNQNHTPAWLEELPDGSIKVRFDEGRKPTINGTKVGELIMREPDVDDQIAVKRSNSTPEDQEVALIANLCEVPPADVGKFKIRNYSRLQAALEVFYA